MCCSRGWDGLTPEQYSETWGHVKMALLDWRASTPALSIVRRPNDDSPTTALDAPMTESLWGIDISMPQSPPKGLQYQSLGARRPQRQPNRGAASADGHGRRL